MIFRHRGGGWSSCLLGFIWGLALIGRPLPPASFRIPELNRYFASPPVEGLQRREAEERVATLGRCVHARPYARGRSYSCGSCRSPLIQSGGGKHATRARTQKFWVVSTLLCVHSLLRAVHWPPECSRGVFLSRSRPPFPARVCLCVLCLRSCTVEVGGGWR